MNAHGNTAHVAAARPFAFAKYAHVAFTSVKERLRERAALIARLGFLVVVLTIFSRLWQTLATQAALSARDFVWYMAVTEWIMLSLPAVHLEVEDDVRTGRVASLLPRPISYFGAVFAKAWGELVVRLVTLGPAAFAMAFALTGAGPPCPGALLGTIPFAIASSSILLACYVAIGLTTFWLHDATPVYLIFQKAAFICGGLYVPLDVYPAWLRAAAEWTPFPALLYGPAQFSLSGTGGLALALRLGAWTLVLGAGVSFVYRRALAALEVGGG